jgi:triosephosphate isomerase
MRKILIAGNWKMHGSMMMIRQLLDGIIKGAGDNPTADLAVFPPFPYLSMVRSVAANSSLAWGAQTLNPNSQGAHTGEVSADMLLDMDCRYVLVGHSERRELYRESDEDVADRFAAAHTAGLEPVLCVGESLTQRETGETEAVVARQLDAVIARVGIGAFSRAVIAYEPVWAIGTGLTATPEQAQSVHAFIRDKLRALDGTIASRIKILYGGSVNGSNAADLFAREDIDGGLVGGASLTAGDFLDIVRVTG